MTNDLAAATSISLKFPRYAQKMKQRWWWQTFSIDDKCAKTRGSQCKLRGNIMTHLNLISLLGGRITQFYSQAGRHRIYNVSLVRATIIRLYCISMYVLPHAHQAPRNYNFVFDAARTLCKPISMSPLSEYYRTSIFNKGACLQPLCGEREVE